MSMYGNAQQAALAQTKMLEKELTTCTDSTRVIQILTDLMRKYNIYDVNKCIKYGLELWDIASRQQNKKAMVDAAYCLSGAYHFDINDSEKALEWGFNAVELAKHLNDTAQITNMCYRLGVINFNNQDRERAISYFNYAADLALAQRNHNMVVMANIAAGDVNTDPTTKLQYYEKALETTAFIPDNTERIAQTHVTLGDYYWDLKNTKTATRYYDTFHELVWPLVGKTENIEMLEMLAHVCLRTNRNDECIQVANLIRSFTPSPNASSWYIEQGYRFLAEAHHQNGNDSLAFTTIKHYVTLHDSLNQKRFSDQVLNKVLNIQSEYELKDKAQEYELLKTKATYESTLGYVLSMTILLLCGIIYYLYRLRHRENLQNKKLEQLNQTKDKLLSIISHDVRSPIQALQNIIQLFEQQIATKEDVQTVTKQVNASVQSMAQGLDNLFYWAQNQQEELNAYPELFNLSELIQTQLEQYAPTWQKKGITVHAYVPDKQYIFADLLHTRLIFNNIFSNAIKFTPVEGAITISFVKIDEKTGVLNVENTGTPIREEDIPKIFDPSIRYTRPGTNGEPGSGLGLSLSKDLIHLNKGEIYINKNAENNTLISVKFRLDK